MTEEPADPDQLTVDAAPIDADESEAVGVVPNGNGGGVRDEP